MKPELRWSELKTLLQVYTLSSLAERLKAVYRAMTGGKFTEGLRLVNALLLLIPLTVVDTRREVDELKELLTIARCTLWCAVAAASTILEGLASAGELQELLTIARRRKLPCSLVTHPAHGCAGLRSCS